MKKLLLISIVLLQFSCLKAQVPFPDSAATWVNTVYAWQFTGNSNPQMVLSGVDKYCMNGSDTIVNTVKYTKLYFCAGAYKGGIRDNNGVVYFMPKDSINEFLVYDFNVTAGTTVNYYWEMSGGYGSMTSDVVSNVSTVVYNGIARKVIQFSQASWIEGIGNSMGLFAETWPNVSNWSRELHCMSLNDSTLFQSSNGGMLTPSVYGVCDLTLSANEYDITTTQISIYPNPTSGLLLLNTSKTTASYYELTNVLGETILKSQLMNDKTEVNLSEQKNGIYFLKVVDLKGNYSIKKIIKQ